MRSAQRRSTIGKKTDEVEAGQRSKPIPVRRGRGKKSEMTIGARRAESRMLGPSDGRDNNAIHQAKSIKVPIVFCVR